jgi:hypothetical protein
VVEEMAMNNPPTRAPIAAPIGGTEYQLLATWCEVLDALRPDVDVASIEIEALGAGNVDDIVVHRKSGPTRYVQAKHAMRAASPFNTDYLTGIEGTATASVLQRLLASYRQLRNTAGEPPAMELITDRLLDSGDALLTTLDHSTGLLTPAAMGGGPKSNLGKARQAWLDHLVCDEATLKELLDHLRFRIGHSYAQLERTARLIASSLGFRDDPSTIERGLTYVRDWIQSHERDRTVEQLRRDVSHILDKAGTAALVVVQAIDHLTTDVNPAWSFDWVDLFEGDNANSRRRLREAASWTDVIEPNLLDAQRSLRDAGHSNLLIRYVARQAVTFLVGAYLRRSAGYELTFTQRTELWSSTDDNPDYDLRIALDEEEIGQGDELALVFAVTHATALADVATYVRNTQLPVASVIALADALGASQSAVQTPEHAASLARALAGQAWTIRRDRKPEALHVFFAGPGALAGLIGHRWNMMGKTTVYEHTGVSYEATLTLTW